MEEQKIIAYKSNYPIITYVMWIGLAGAFIGLSYSNDNITYLDYLFGLAGLIALFLLIRHLMIPNILLSEYNKKLNIHRYKNVIEIEYSQIKNLDIKYNRSKGVSYRHGTLLIHLKSGETYEVKLVANLSVVKSTILNNIS